MDPKPLVYALHDSLMLLAPRGWTKIELSIARTSEGLRVTELNTRGEGATTPKPAPQLFVNPQEEALKLSEALTDLYSELKGRWQPGKVLIERPGTQFADWKLLQADGSVGWFTRLERDEVHSLLITDALFDTIEGSERAFHDLQGGLQQRLGRVEGFAFDAEHGMLRLDRRSGALEVPAQIVGSYLPDVFTWVWSWSDPQARDASSGRVKRVCAPDLKQDGMAAFWRPHFHCEEGFAWALAGNVAVSIGARGLFRAQPPDSDGALFFAVMDFTAQA